MLISTSADTRGTEYSPVTVNNTVTAPLPGELLLDGSFETSGVLSFGVKSTTALSGWRTNTSIEVWGYLYNLAHPSSNGKAHVEIDSGTAAGNNLYQSVQTVAGKNYALSFDFAQRSGTTTATNAFEVVWNGNVVGKIVPYTTSWSKANFLVTGTGGLDKLEFRELATDKDSAGGLLDNVSLRSFSTGFGGASNTDALNKISIVGETSAFLSKQADDPFLLRDVSGFGNNVENPLWGNTDQPFLRVAPAQYGDTGSNPRGVVNGVQTLPNERDISNAISNQDENRDGVEENQANEFGTNLFLMSFGQFFDHGLDFVKRGTETYSFKTETGASISITRGEQDEFGNQINKTSPFIDQNQTYGSHDSVTYYLRKSIGIDASGNGTISDKSAKLLSGANDGGGREMLPTYQDVLLNNGVSKTVIDAAIAANSFAILAADPDFVDFRNVKDPKTGDLSGHPLLLDINANANPALAGVPGVNFSVKLLLDHYVGGDGRVNENIALTPIHTVWHREHDYQVDKLRAANPGWSEQKLFEAAKIIVEMEYQHIVFGEFADAMSGGIPGSDKYRPEVNATISAEFAHAVYRVGHSMINETIPFTDAEGKIVQMSLVQAFLNPQGFKDVGVDALIDGTTRVLHQRIDENIVNAVRNQLLGERINDLAAINIARGRETGIPSLNELRKYLYENGLAIGSQASELGLEAKGNSHLRPYANWAEFAANLRDPSLVEQFKQVYGANDADVNKVDLWIGGLAEKPSEGQLGDTFGFIFQEQLARLREGDRFYYTERLHDTQLLDDIESQSFADVIMRNSGVDYLHDDVFKVAKTTMMSSTALTFNGTTSAEVLVGNDLANSIAGSGGEDTLYGLGGNDTLNGGDGNDGIRSGAGDDTASGGLGNDRVIGAAGNDTLSGDDGDDNLYGDDGDDRLSGGAGIDELLGGAGNDSLSGGIGDDQLRGGSGSDRLFGEAGMDTLEGGSGADSLDGGDGNDSLEGGAGDDQLNGNAGDDKVEFFYAGSGISINLATGTAASVETGTDTLISIENASGSAYDDIITGSAGNNVLEGYNGDDTLDGGAGNDTLDGGDGIDKVSYLSAGSAVSVNLGAGTAFGRAPGTDMLKQIEAVDGSAFNDTLVGSKTADRLSGNAGNDILRGGSGADSLEGGAGNDVIHGGRGADQLTGGDGADRFLYASVAEIGIRSGSTDTIADFVSGVDRIDLSKVDANRLATGVQQFSFIGTAALSGVAGQLRYEKFDNAGTDNDYTVLSGDVDGDKSADFSVRINGLSNLAAADIIGAASVTPPPPPPPPTGTITGTSGNDTLVGTAGDDTFDGLAGYDTMTGNAGADRYVFRSAADIGLVYGSTDVITDFVSGVDKIDLSLLDANSVQAGDQAFTFIGSGFMAATPGQLRFVQYDNTGTDNDYTLLRGDAGGDLTADFSLRINGLVTIAATDLIL